MQLRRCGPKHSCGKSHSNPKVCHYYRHRRNRRRTGANLTQRAPNTRLRQILLKLTIRFSRRRFSASMRDSPVSHPRPDSVHPILLLRAQNPPSRDKTVRGVWGHGMTLLARSRSESAMATQSPKPKAAQAHHHSQNASSVANQPPLPERPAPLAGGGTRQFSARLRARHGAP